MKITNQINRALIICDAYIRGHITKKNSTDKKTIGIVFQQLFGDAVVFQNALIEYSLFFSEKNEYNIKLLIRPSVASFIKNVIEIPKTIEICEIDFKKFLCDYSYYKAIVKLYRGAISTIVVPGTSLSAEIFSVSNNAKRKVGLVRSSDITRPIIMALFAKMAYTERVRPNREDMMLQRHRLLLNYFGDKTYKAKLPILLTKENIVREERYCVMCPGSSKIEKCWPIERFAEVADFIIETYDMNIHLCGGADEIHFEKLIIDNVRNSKRILSHIGKTNFSDWSSIVQHADLVVGNDSATMHIAAASRRKAICIAGAYDKYQFFPYKVDELDEGECLPVTLVKDMFCAWCRTTGYDAGYGNEECKKRIKENKCACCIDLITVSDVIKKIGELMR